MKRDLKDEEEQELEKHEDSDERDDNVLSD